MPTVFYIVILMGFLYFLYTGVVFYRTRVPHVVTPSKRIPVIFSELNITQETILYDLGCGKGDFLFAAEKYGIKELKGFELSPLLALYGTIKAKIKKSKVKIEQKDFFQADISMADIIYLFLVPSVVKKLAIKLKKEAKKGAIVVCLSDQVPDLRLVKTIDTEPGKKNSVKIYFYQII